MEYLHIDGRIILKHVLRKWLKDLNWLNLVQDRDKWCTFVNIVMHFLVP
jgi:hypothetical protein